MRINTQIKLILLSTTAFWVFLGCKKSSFLTEKQASPITVAHFFNNTANLPATTQRIVTLLQQKENKFHFVAFFVNHQGLPLWQNASISVQSSGSSNHARTSAVVGTDTIVKIPLQLQGYPTVHGYLLCTVSADSVTAAVIDGRQYAQYGFLGNTANEVVAENLATEIMQFNYRIFGNNQFVLTDNRLFGGHTVGNITGIARIASFDSATGGNRSAGARSILCPGGRTTVSVTSLENHCPYGVGQCSGPGGTCDNCPDFCVGPSTVVYSFCNQNTSQQAPVWTLEQPGDPIGGGRYRQDGCPRPPTPVLRLPMGL